MNVFFSYRVGSQGKETEIELLRNFKKCGNLLCLCMCGISFSSSVLTTFILDNQCQMTAMKKLLIDSRADRKLVYKGQG